MHDSLLGPNGKHYNTKVKSRPFEIEDLVLKKMMTTTKNPTQGKLGSN